MNKIPFKKYLLIPACLLMIAGVGGVLSSNSLALANEEDKDQTAQTAEKEAQKKALAQQEALRKQQALTNQQLSEKKGRLDETRLKTCQNREKTINGIMSRISSRGNKHLGVINKISERVQAFYKEKDLTAVNYDALVAAVNTAKTSAEAKLAAIKSSSVEFKCDGSDPKGAGQQFKDNLKLEISALKEYKTAVKNLIVVVKSANSASEGSE